MKASPPAGKTVKVQTPEPMNVITQQRGIQLQIY